MITPSVVLNNGGNKKRKKEKKIPKIVATYVYASSQGSASTPLGPIYITYTPTPNKIKSILILLKFVCLAFM